jgi:hypothetical protein
MFISGTVFSVQKYIFGGVTMVHKNNRAEIPEINPKHPCRKSHNP